LHLVQLQDNTVTTTYG